MGRYLGFYLNLCTLNCNSLTPNKHLASWEKETLKNIYVFWSYYRCRGICQEIHRDTFSAASPPVPKFHRTTAQHQNQETDIDTIQSRYRCHQPYMHPFVFLRIKSSTILSHGWFCIITTTMKTPNSVTKTRLFFIGTRSPSPSANQPLTGPPYL